MPLSETIVMLTDLVMHKVPTATSSDIEWASALRTIIAYRERGRLDEWEVKVNCASPKQRLSQLQEMLGELEMLGTSNLYQAFDVRRTIAFYDRLRPYFSERGVELPISPDLDGW